MHAVSVDRFFLAAAVVLLGFVTDLPRTLIEIFDLSVLRLGGNPPYLLPAALALIGAYARMQRLEMRDALEPGDWVLLFAVLLAVLIECLHWASGRSPDFHMAAEALWWTVAYYAVKQHIRAGGKVQRFAVVALAFIVVVAMAHLSALLVARAGGFTNDRLVGEIAGRNGISLLLVGGVYIHWFLLGDPARRAGWQALLLPGLAVLHALVNGARAALLALLLLAFARLALGLRLRDPALAMLVMGVALGAVSVSLGYEPLLAGGLTIVTQADTGRRATIRENSAGWYHHSPRLSALAPDVGIVRITDDERSVHYRLAANRSLIHRVAENPITGLGERAALAERAGGYPSHTYYLLVLAAYGIVGLVAFVVAIGIAMYAPAWNRRRCAIVLGMFMVTVLTFANDFYYWFAMLAAMVSAPPPEEART